MLHACIISTGTELLLGSTIDSNCNFLSQKLCDLGVRVIARFTVGDNREQISNAFNNALKLADLVICSGGLGPTLDDLTKEIACEVAGCQMELVEEEVKHLQEYFARRKRKMPEKGQHRECTSRKMVKCWYCFLGRHGRCRLSICKKWKHCWKEIFAWMINSQPVVLLRSWDQVNLR